LSLIRAVEDYSPPDTTNAETTVAKTTTIGVDFPATAIINNTKTEKEMIKSIHMKNTSSDLAPKKNQTITKLLTKILEESTTVV
jgi:hypothetical protein